MQIRQQQRDMDRVVVLGRGRVSRARRGFTMVEILTAVAIIAILASMLLLGFKYVGASSKAKNTRVRLETLRNMLHEFEIKGGKMQMIDEQYAKTSGQWRVIERQVLPKGNIGEENATLRFSNDPAIERTQKVMQIILGVPENRALLNSMPPEALMDSDKTDPSTKKALKMDPPLLVDAWNNPILFGPRRANPWPPAGVNPSTAPPAASTLVWGVTGMSSPAADYQPKDGKGVWVSAGPDEDFSLGDDNLYSDDAK